MSAHLTSPVELQIDQLAACNVGGRIKAAIYKIDNREPGSAKLILEELLCFIEQRDLPDESPIGGWRMSDPETRLLEAVADIAFLAGAQRYHSGDSREDVSQFIAWAREFETRREVSDDGEETYNGENYMIAIEEFSVSKFREKGCCE